MNLRELVDCESTSVQRVGSLLRGLTPRSSFARAVLHKGQEWGNVEELLATLCEQIDQNSRLLYGANRSKNDPAPWKPLHVRRPWEDEPERPKPVTGSELAAFFKGPREVDADVITYVPNDAPEEGGG